MFVFRKWLNKVKENNNGKLFYKCNKYFNSFTVVRDIFISATIIVNISKYFNFNLVYKLYYRN